MKEAKNFFLTQIMLAFLLLKVMNIEKSWSIYKFTSLANKILSKNKVPVFFIEKNKIDLIDKIKNQVILQYFPN